MATAVRCCVPAVTDYEEIDMRNDSGIPFDVRFSFSTFIFFSDI